MKKSVALRGAAPVERASSLGTICDLAAGIVVGVGIGYFCDDYLDTLPLFLFLFSVLGVAGGSWNAYRRLARSY